MAICDCLRAQRVPEQALGVGRLRGCPAGPSLAGAEQTGRGDCDTESLSWPEDPGCQLEVWHLVGAQGSQREVTWGRDRGMATSRHPHGQPQRERAQWAQGFSPGSRAGCRQPSGALPRPGHLRAHVGTPRGAFQEVTSGPVPPQCAQPRGL